ncbi:hypothetical protein QR680_007112 [Steinernema hermaphroditum]|uniref:AN1-type domain-containing protein n=1 Tax=Steinernema hermaphroditum TaxID=289476 RepID=A0AA39LYJ7_9BILA|nr:hypothetical protein QR680_007112 [Steinernema hermaphroditum]
MSPIMCKVGCGFFGTEKFDSFCSKCFKARCPEKFQEIASDSASVTPRFENTPKRAFSLASPKAQETKPSPESSTPPAPKKTNRCTTCNKRVGLLGSSCRCGGLFCSLHRYEKEHNCGFDYKSLER